MVAPVAVLSWGYNAGSCGNSFVTRSTVEGDLTVELCNECHPFFTGKQKLVDSGGRVERFNKRYGRRKNAPKGDD